MFTKKPSQIDDPVVSGAVEDDVQAWLDNIKSKSPNPSSTKAPSPMSSRSSKSPTKPTKSTKKIVKKSNSGKKG